jgi:hypothetical protein
MRPVEIEFLVKDSTKAGAQRVSASIDRETMKILGKMDRIQAKIDKLRSTNNEALDQTENIAQIQKLEAQMDKLQAKMSKVAATKSIGPSPSEIDAVTQRYNGLNASIQQIARELPAAAMGPQMFFMAISNNLPIFADELSRARKEYAAMTAAGEKGTPVWKQLLSSIMSWQTLLAVGIMLLVTYGDEIGKWVTSLFKGKQALDAAAVATEEYHNAIAKGRVNAAKQISEAETLLKVATDESRAMDQRREAAEKMQQLYPDYLGNMSTEAIMAGEAAEAYEGLKNRLIEVAQSRAAMDRLSELAAAKLSPELEAIKKAEEEYEAAKRKREEYLQAMQGSGANPLGVLIGSKIYAGTGDAETALTDALTAFSEKYGIAGNNIIEINEAIEASEQKLITAATAFNEVSSKTTKTATKTDVQGGDQLLQAMRDLEDQQNAIIEDGYEKRRAIAKTEFERQLHDIRVNREKLLAEDRKDTGGANANKINTIFDAQILALAGRYNQTLKQIEQDQQAATTKAYGNLLEKYETYLQKRERLTREYDKDIAALAASPENQAVAEQAKEKALQDLDLAFARQFPQFEAWANSIVTESVDKLRELIALAEHELELMDENVNADPEALAKARAGIALLRQKLAEAQGKPSGDKDTGYDAWEKLSEVLGRVNDDLQEVGDTLGGVFGEVVDVAGTIATSTISIISGIKQLTKTSVEGVKGTAEAGAAAMASLEKASVILTIISAALQVYQALAGLFKNTESSEERSLRLAKEFNEELRVMNERARINQDDDSIFGDAIYENFRQNINVMRDALRDLEKDKQAIMLRNPYAFLGIPMLGNFSSLEDSIGKMQVQTQHSTWFRSAKYASLKDLIPELFGDDGQINMDALKEFADESNDTFQKLSKTNQDLIKSLVSDWDTYEEALDATRDYLSSIFGELGDTILDTMINVADGTMSAADAMTTRLEALSDVVRNFAKNMIYAMTLGPILDEAQKEIEKIQLGEGTEEEKFEAMMAVLDSVMDDVTESQDVASEWWDRLKTMAKNKGFDLDGGETQQGKAGAMYTVSQDSFTRVEGIATSIQSHITSIDLKFDNITAQFTAQLDAMNAIVTNTSPISSIYTLMSTIYREGLKVK